MSGRASPRQVERFHCNQCLRSTRHDLLLERDQGESEEIPDDDDGTPGFVIDWERRYSVFECRGCGGITLRRRGIAHDLEIDQTTYYPPRVSRQIPRWLYDLPETFRGLLQESYVALHAGSKRLAVMGARALADLFMTQKVGDVGTFQNKLDALVDEGLLSSQDRRILDDALEAGHAVSHRGHLPKDSHVNLVFDIVENLLQRMVLVTKTPALAEETPKRGSSTDKAR